MTAAGLLLGATLAAAQAAQSGAESDRRRPWGRGDADLIAAQSPYWLKTYSLLPHKEYWSLTLSVRDMKRDLSRIMEAFTRAGGALTQPLESFPASLSAGTQQLSFRLSLKSAQKVLKPLRKIGSFAEPRVRPALDAVPLAEVRDKIQRLMAEKAAHAKELSAMPASAAVLDELLEHLLLVEAVHEKADAEVLLNVTIQEKR